MSMIAEIEGEAEIYCPFIVHETAFQMDDAPTCQTTADAERLERCGMGESAECWNEGFYGRAQRIPTIQICEPQGWAVP
jgi:hypothetical protein